MSIDDNGTIVCAKTMAWIEDYPELSRIPVENADFKPPHSNYEEEWKVQWKILNESSAACRLKLN